MPSDPKKSCNKEAQNLKSTTVQSEQTEIQLNDIDSPTTSDSTPLELTREGEIRI